MQLERDGQAHPGRRGGIGDLIITAITVAALVLVPATGAVAQDSDDVVEDTGVVPAPLISRDAPASASSEIHSAQLAVDRSYANSWRGSVPGSITLDLAGTEHSRTALVVWYSDGFNVEYDIELAGVAAYNLPRDYTISTSPDGEGWTTAVTIEGNTLHSRQHLLDLTGARYVRMQVSAINGSQGNRDVALNLDVHDAGSTEDGFLFVGDSITARSMVHRDMTFSQAVNALAPDHFPYQESAAISGWNASDALPYIEGWLEQFHGRYVALAFGTNQQVPGGSTEQFESDMQALIDSVINAGKTPIIPHIPYSTRSERQTAIRALNRAIDRLVEDSPQAMAGPDFYRLFADRPQLISEDGIHPTTEGEALLRHRWAAFVVEDLYGISPPPEASNLSILRVFEAIYSLVVT